MNARRAAIAGLVATGAATALWLVEPVLGLPRLAVGSMLSSFLAVATAYLPIWPVVGWLVHLLVGIALALVYAKWVVGRLPGGPLMQGIFYGCGVFLFAQVTFMPLVGAGVFSRGDVPLLAGSLIGHGVFGGLIGLLYGVDHPAGLPPTA